MSYKISQLSTYIDNRAQELIEELIKTQEECAKEFRDLVEQNIEIPSEARSPGQFTWYKNSINVGSTERKGNTISTWVYSGLTVYWDKVGKEVPVGAFLEWGTGPLGEATNAQLHGYSYTTDKPWDKHTYEQWEQTGTWGIQARPHFLPAKISYENRYKEKVMETVKKVWMK